MLYASALPEQPFWHTGGGAAECSGSSARWNSVTTAVMAIIRDGFNVTEIAKKFGVGRQSLCRWMARHEVAASTRSSIARTDRKGSLTKWHPRSRDAGAAARVPEHRGPGIAICCSRIADPPLRFEIGLAITDRL